MPRYKAKIWTFKKPVVVELEAFNIEQAARTIKKKHPNHTGFRIEEAARALRGSIYIP